MAMILGTLTIGQAPRPDVTPILDRHIPGNVRRVHRGLLDGLSRSQIAAKYAAEADEAVLVTRLADAGSVQLSARKVHAALQAELDALEHGAAPSCCCCAPARCMGFGSSGDFCWCRAGSFLK